MSKITQVYTGDGQTTLYPVPWKTLSKAFVRIIQIHEGVSTDLSQQAVWINDSAVNISPAPPAGASLTITRTTPSDRLIVAFTDSAVHKGSDMDRQATQLLHVLEESVDTANLTAGYIDTATKALENMQTLAGETAAEAANAAADAAKSLELAQQLTGEAAATETQNGIVRLGTKEEHESGAAGMAAQPSHVVGIVNSAVRGAFPQSAPDNIGTPLALVPQENGAFIWQKVGGGVPVGVEAWCSGTTPPPGWLDMSIDNGPLPRAAYPALWKFAESSGNIITDAEWLEQAATQRGSCGAFSTGDDSTTFRIPMHIRVFSRARDIWNNVNVGMWQEDVIRNITGAITEGLYRNPADSVFSGAFVRIPQSNAGATDSGTAVRGGLSFDASRVVPTGDENRPVCIVRLPIIKAWDVATVPANLEVGALVNQIAAVGDRVNSEAHIRSLAGTILWKSDGYTIASATYTTVTHGLNIDPTEVTADVIIRCKTAEHGYSVGDVLLSFGATDQQPAATNPLMVTPTTIFIRTGAYLRSIHKTSGAVANLTMANWEYIFRIWYGIKEI